MEVTPYVESIRTQLLVAAAAGGDEQVAGVAERLVAALEPAARLALQDALAAAAEEITCELAPGRVEVRLRGRDPEFVVTLPPPEEPPPASGAGPAAGTDEGGGAEEVARINLRLPERLKGRVEVAAAGEGLSINAWLVRAVAAALDAPPPRRERRAPLGGDRFSGWAG